MEGMSTQPEFVRFVVREPAETRIIARRCKRDLPLARRGEILDVVDVNNHVVTEGLPALPSNRRICDNLLPAVKHGAVREKIRLDNDDRFFFRNHIRV